MSHDDSYCVAIKLKLVKAGCSNFKMDKMSKVGKISHYLAHCA